MSMCFSKPRSDQAQSLGLIEAAAQQALELTPLRVEQDRVDFEGWIRPSRLPDLQGGAAHAQAVRRH